jgi:hypothetical protein
MLGFYRRFGSAPIGSLDQGSRKSTPKAEPLFVSPRDHKKNKNLLASSRGGLRRTSISAVALQRLLLVTSLEPGCRSTKWVR